MPKRNIFQFIISAIFGNLNPHFSDFRQVFLTELGVVQSFT
ncbi:hypothetical protein E6C60_0437 [Paenibacillus algicola]|uniref:Uncharacterized protein n=1 Tax=Paenibacillus algicola TaxID=2565926 RepID=A0A4P8XI67_9BACL|nr:hypothetical protein E6C60_0437 [Paenibacillus algicola]